MKVRDCYIGQTMVKYKAEKELSLVDKMFLIALIQKGTMSGTLGDKGWWIVKKEFRLNESIG